MGGVTQSMKPGGLSDGPGVISDFASLFAESRYSHLGGYGQYLLRKGFRLVPAPPLFIRDTTGRTITAQPYRLNDPEQTTFYVLPTNTDPSPNYFTLMSKTRRGQTLYAPNLYPKALGPFQPIPPRGVPLRNTSM